MRGGEHSQGEAELEALMEEKLAAESAAARDPTAISAMVAHAEADAKALKESNPELADRTGTLKEKLFKALNKPAKSLALIGEGTAVQGQATLGGYDLNECKYLSAQFREGSCAAVSVRIGDDDSLEADALELTCAEQETQRGEFPGPLPVIARGCFLERIQLAQCAAQGASAVMLTLAQTGKERLATLLNDAKEIGLEVIVRVADKDEVAAASALGVKLLCLGDCGGLTKTIELLEHVPEGIVKIADVEVIDVRGAWKVRDAGFNSLIVNKVVSFVCMRDRVPPTAVLKAMLSKGSVAFGLGMQKGRLEGAKEQLGTLDM